MESPESSLRVVFCAHPLRRGAPDPVYAQEAAAAAAAGVGQALLRIEPLVERADAGAATRDVPARAPGPALYRGWMLAPDQYASLHAALASKGDLLLTTPEAYRHVHWLPDSYEAIQQWTARSAWLPAAEVSEERAVALARTFGKRPLLVKDYVKSRKHEWAEACFIPDATDGAAVTRVIRRFLELTGDELQGGLVLREFLDLERVGTHPRSGMPLAREWRVFWLDGVPVLVAPYGPEVTGEPPPVEAFAPAAARVQSRFFTMDLARRTSGDWIIVELGDGQVAGLPEGADPAAFYGAIAARLLSARRPAPPPTAPAPAATR
jgi:hypothetical protein